MDYRFRLLNVFAESQFGGNPLCVFEDARGLDALQMQTLAAQFNLSETVFLLPPHDTNALASLRIFTTTSELPFAGHPTIGAASVVAALKPGFDCFMLQCQAGLIEIRGESLLTPATPIAPAPAPVKASHWTLTVPVNQNKTFDECFRTPTQDLHFFAQLLGLQGSDFLSEPMWVNTGNEHLLFPLNSAQALERANPNAAMLEAWPSSLAGRQNAYLFAIEGDQSGGGDAENLTVSARYWFVKQGSIAVDPATGSAAANWAAWHLRHRHGRKFAAQVKQGHQINRPSKLLVSAEIDTNQVPRIQVGGNAIEIGSGVLHL
ncbi:PhzF family phenazine biosynthesis protein [Undibacterium cyanobacteriorum]|uniref:PhzF family phenazine biosynthesis protein n=1 Tax=Undibacterium cyanobacteriorum TaxID=3073561 RepID=A0ABY9RE66_9BURK|nr:PhzF family phenazine biosynthesis protein [Undibacterium sp. 20NA77.5]WMW79503.1 PhzF family phenazine biosynthesis protein [Undibacterium sp. 20NA77.5]